MITTDPAALVARTRHDPAIALWVVAGACWLSTAGLVVAGGGQYGHHDFVLQSGVARPLLVAAFVTVWLVMVGAMMLPTTVAMVRLFWVVSARQQRPLASRAVFLSAYVLVWTAFALVALAGDLGVHELVERWSWLKARPGLILGSTLALAGAFQFSGLKEACLTACRSPLSMLWSGYRRGVAGAWQLGLRHGLSCLGCCWALMLVMFATGVASLAWMVGLTAVMLAEKTTRIGASLSGPVGLGLLAAGAAIALPALL